MLFWWSVSTSFSRVKVNQYIQLDLEKAICCCRCFFFFLFKYEKQKEDSYIWASFKKAILLRKERNKAKLRFIKKQSKLYWQTAAKHLLDRFSILFRQAYTCSIMHFMERVQILGGRVSTVSFKICTICSDWAAGSLLCRKRRPMWRFLSQSFQYFGHAVYEESDPPK